eukprot:3387977-Prorocentrum_lima.AAC.1
MAGSSCMQKAGWTCLDFIMSFTGSVFISKNKSKNEYSALQLNTRLLRETIENQLRKHLRDLIFYMHWQLHL